MPNKEKLTPEEKLNVGIENFEILKDNRDNFSVYEQLMMASSIRDNLSTDKCLIASCNENSIISDKRRQLLDCIHVFQNNLICENTRIADVPSFSNCRVMNYDMAKEALTEMIDEEISSNMFSETDNPPLYSTIKDCKKHIDRIQQVYDNCKHGKYNVLIMGDFQSGKSTTLDAFCDGRHISAIGKGTATSAVLVSVTYAEKELMKVNWRGKEQFYAIFEKIKQYMPGFVWKEFDLDDKSSRDKLSKTINDLRKSDYCPNVGQGDAKFLMLCDFVLKYYGTTELQEKKSSLRSISDISDMTKFPDNGESTWKKSGVDSFSIDDVIFIFIDSVECFVPSETLKELNCTITDSPGLFNSSYDSMVTEGAMIRAHAIMYVLPYYKEMSQDICKSLYTIKEKYPDVHRKLFIVNNLQFDNNDFFSSNCERVHSMYGSNKAVIPYDGKLSYLILLKKLYEAGMAKESDYLHLMKVTTKTFVGEIKVKTFANFEDALSYHLKKYDLNYENTDNDEVLDEYGFRKLINSLKRFIISNESYAVIVSNGLAAMWCDLKSIMDSLQLMFIEPYNTSHETLVSRWQTRINNATEFQTKVNSIARTKLYDGKDSLFERMVNEENSKLFTSDFYSDLSEAIAGVLYDNKSSLIFSKTLLENKSLFEKTFSEKAYPLIKGKIVEYVNRKLQFLVDMIDHGQDEIMINMFVPVANNIELVMQQEWNGLFGDNKDFIMQNYIVFPKGLGKSQMNDAHNNSYNTDNLAGFGVDMALIGGLVAQISVIVASIATMIAGYISLIIYDVTGTSFLISVFLGTAGAVVATFAPEWVRNKFVKMLSGKIRPKLDSVAITGFNELVKHQMNDMFEKYINSLKVNVRKMENERDLALNPTGNQEKLCFRAVEAITHINNQIDAYDNYKQSNIVDETL